jgi:hypothetical protein
LEKRKKGERGRKRGERREGEEEGKRPRYRSDEPFVQF